MDKLTSDKSIYPMFAYSISNECVWVRAFRKLIIHVLSDDCQPLFSERVGCRRYIKIPLTRWRIMYGTKTLKEVMAIQEQIK